MVNFGDSRVSIRGRRCRIVLSAVRRLQGVALVVEGDVVNLLELATLITVNTFPGSRVMSPALGGHFRGTVRGLCRIASMTQ